MRKNYTHIVMVIDESGSMVPQRSDTIGSINGFLHDQKEHPRDFWTGNSLHPREHMVRQSPPMKGSISLYTFGNVVRLVYSVLPLASAPNLTTETYKPKGSTPLLDAIGRAITETGGVLSAMAEEDRPDKVIVLIVTDGQENSSSQYTKDQIAAMVTHQRTVYGWEFVFIGADVDAIDVARSYGMNVGTAAFYDKAETGSTYSIASASVMRSRVTGQSVQSFTDEDRTKMSAGKWKKTTPTDSMDSGKKGI